MTRKQRRKLEAEREDAEDADEGPDSDAEAEVLYTFDNFLSSRTAVVPVCAVKLTYNFSWAFYI